jgi:nitroreductase
VGFYELIVSRRTVRQFKPVPIARSLLEQLVNAARLAPSAGNLQPLEFVVADDDEICGQIFACLRWAGYISPEGNPKPGQEPRAYIIPVINLKVREKGYEYDVGAAMENMILAAWENGLGSCWLISVDREKIASIVSLPEGFKIDCVLALGHPAETPVAERYQESHKYWKDAKGILHVPKRDLERIIHFNRFG